MIRGVIRLALSPVKLAAGAVSYGVTKRTPDFGHQAMIMIYCWTKGYGLDLINGLIRFTKGLAGMSSRALAAAPTDPIADTRGADFVVSQMREHGFCVLNVPLPKNLLDGILHYSLKTPAIARGKNFIEVYPREAPKAVRYEFLPDNILKDTLFNSIVASRFAKVVAEKYLGKAPWLDVVGLWWHTGFSKHADSEAAQLYHFDMDRPKWFKVFIYITDVTTESGPHCFIRGSHRSGAVPYRLLRRGYVRIEDEEVYAHFGKAAEMEFCGPRGTIIFEDTRGLHKGKHVVSGDRLIFQMQYSNSLFGATYPNTHVVDSNLPLKQALKELQLNCAYMTN